MSRHGISDPSWKSGPPEPDHYCTDHLTPIPELTEFDGTYLFETWGCELCEATATATYQADVEEYGECPIEDTHIDDNLRDLLVYDSKNRMVYEFECGSCGTIFDVEYTYEGRGIPDI